LILLSWSHGLNVNIFSYLFGSITTISQPDLWLMGVLAVIVLVAIWLYGLAPEQITRAPEGAGGWALSGAVEERSQLALAGWRDFLGSPLWGWGFTRYYSHNLFVGTLADQGLVGAAFLATMLPFRIALVGAHRRLALREPFGRSVRVAVSMLPTLVFTLVIAAILRDRFGVSPAVFGGLIIYTVVNTLIPGFALRIPPPDFETPHVPELEIGSSDLTR